MKKKIAIVLLISTLGCCFELQAQNVRFKQYFTDATLRIDYLRVGNRQHDTIESLSHERLPLWAGSLTQLLDPFDNGDYRIVVRDAKSGRELYSRGYNTLFREYRDTPQGADSVAAFEEVVRVPWPRRTVEICFQKPKNAFSVQLSFRPRFGNGAASP